MNPIPTPKANLASTMYPRVGANPEARDENELRKLPSNRIFVGPTRAVRSPTGTWEMPIPRKKAVPKSPSPDTFSLKEEAISENAEGIAYQLIPTAPSFAAIHMIELRLPPCESSLTCDGQRTG